MKILVYLGKKISLILALGLLLAMPVSALAEGGTNYVFGNFNTNYSDPSPSEPVYENNPKPVIRTINPKSGDYGVGHETVTITGFGFIPRSVAKVNGANRPTTFIDSSHLLVEVNLNEPFSTEDGFYVTVSNPAPGGGTSNSAFFRLEGIPVGVNGYNNYGYRYGANTENNVRTSSLASSVIVGGVTFLPSSLVQWIFVFILIMAIVILARRIFGHREAYDNTPLKHA